MREVKCEAGGDRCGLSGRGFSVAAECLVCARFQVWDPRNNIALTNCQT